MVTDWLSPFWVHEITIETSTGTGPEGDTYAAPYRLACFIDSTRRLVRSATGEQVVSSAQIMAPPGSPLVPPESRVTLPASHGGHTTTVISCANRYGAGLGTPDHVEITLA